MAFPNIYSRQIETTVRFILIKRKGGPGEFTLELINGKSKKY